MENGSYTVTSSEIEMTTVTATVDASDTGLADAYQNKSAPANMYVMKRNFIHQLMDVALLMANVSQLKALLAMPSSDRYFYVILCFIALSISFQVAFTICMLIIWALEKQLEAPDGKPLLVSDLTDDQHKKQSSADMLDKIGNILVLMIIVANVFITGFGVESHDDMPQIT